MSDIEKNLDKKTPEGIVAFSALLASDPALQVYRSFNELASRNLVCMQSELFELEERLRYLDEEDQHLVDSGVEGSGEVKQAAKSWTFALQSERERERVTLTRQIRSLLAEYQDALIRQKKLLSCERPRKLVRTSLEDWVEQEFPFIGRDQELFTRYAKDMIALRVPHDEDRLTHFLAPYLGTLLRKRDRHDHSSREAGPIVGYYSETLTRYIVSTISAIIAASLLIGAIVALYEVQSAGAKLALISVFTVLFAASVGLLTNARRSDVYAASAAYAAVLVVFVGGSI